MEFFKFAESSAILFNPPKKPLSDKIHTMDTTDSELIFVVLEKYVDRDVVPIQNFYFYVGNFTDNSIAFIDNQIHIGHGVVIGKNVLIAAQVGVAGKTIIEDDVILWGQVGVNKSLTIGKGAVVNGQSGVTVSIEGGKTYFGTPAIEAKEKLKEMAWVRRIPEMWDKLTK